MCPIGPPALSPALRPGLCAPEPSPPGFTRRCLAPRPSHPAGTVQAQAQARARLRELKAWGSRLPKDRAPRACGRNSTPTYPLSWIQTHKDAKKSRKTRRHKDIHNSETREHNESFGNSEVHTDTQR